MANKSLTEMIRLIFCRTGDTKPPPAIKAIHQLQPGHLVEVHDDKGAVYYARLKADLEPGLFLADLFYPNAPEKRISIIRVNVANVQTILNEKTMGYGRAIHRPETARADLGFVSPVVPATPANQSVKAHIGADVAVGIGIYGEPGQVVSVSWPEKHCDIMVYVHRRKGPFYWGELFRPGGGLQPGDNVTFSHGAMRGINYALTHLAVQRKGLI